MAERKLNAAEKEKFGRFFVAHKKKAKHQAQFGKHAFFPHFTDPF